MLLNVCWSNCIDSFIVKSICMTWWPACVTDVSLSPNIWNITALIYCSPCPWGCDFCAGDVIGNLIHSTNSLYQCIEWVSVIILHTHLHISLYPLKKSTNSLLCWWLFKSATCFSSFDMLGWSHFFPAEENHVFILHLCIVLNST